MRRGGCYRLSGRSISAIFSKSHGGKSDPGLRAAHRLRSSTMVSSLFTFPWGSLLHHLQMSVKMAPSSWAV